MGTAESSQASGRRSPLERSLQWRIVLALAVTAFAGVALLAIQSARQQARLQSAMALQWVEPLRAKAAMAWSDDAACTDWNIERLLDHAAVRAVAYWGGDGKRLAARALQQNDLAGLDSPPVLDGAVPLARNFKPAGRVDKSHAYYRIDFSLPGTTKASGPRAVSAVVRLNDPPAGFWDWSVAVGSLVAVAGIVFVLLLRWLRRNVLRPMEALRRLASTAHLETDTELAARSDELGELARAMSDLREETATWREHAWRVERRMDSRVAEQTKSISRDLKQMQREIWIDALTGVKNRRLMQERLPAIFDAQRAAKKDLTIVMLDLDHFKQLNDARGHTAGDEVLAFAGELLRQCTREEDLVVRYGGDEFALILPGMHVKESVALVERILAMFRQRTRVMTRLDPPPGMTAGIASLQANHPTTYQDLLKMADQALYAAKRAGRGQASVSGHVATGAA
ncbi:putative diguanylate cyclase AdrA [Phycisphaerae bacterium RAS2]|nr:putative diguanylate cyclase AdrA [Phycisphaerae bacterium RAS2]